MKEAAALIRVLHDKLTRTQGEVDKVMEEVRQSGPAAENKDEDRDCQEGGEHGDV